MGGSYGAAAGGAAAPALSACMAGRPRGVPAAGSQVALAASKQHPLRPSFVRPGPPAGRGEVRAAGPAASAAATSALARRGGGGAGRAGGRSGGGRAGSRGRRRRGSRGGGGGGVGRGGGGGAAGQAAALARAPGGAARRLGGQQPRRQRPRHARGLRRRRRPAPGAVDARRPCCRCRGGGRGASANGAGGLLPAGQRHRRSGCGRRPHRQPSGSVCGSILMPLEVG